MYSSRIAPFIRICEHVVFFAGHRQFFTLHSWSMRARACLAHRLRKHNASAGRRLRGPSVTLGRRQPRRWLPLRPGESHNLAHRAQGWGPMLAAHIPTWFYRSFSFRLLTLFSHCVCVFFFAPILSNYYGRRSLYWLPSRSPTSFIACIPFKNYKTLN